MRIRLVTFNIRVCIQQGLDPIADILRGESPDVVALQEVGRHWVMGHEGDTAAELAAMVGLDHHLFVPSLTRGAAHYGHALLSAHPFLAAKFRRLPQQVDEPRTLLDCQLEHPDGVVRVVSTHLSHIEDREAQGAVLLEAMQADKQLPTVVMGDLNATPNDDAFLAELLKRTTDADPTGAHTFPAEEPSRRIDYILARDGRFEELVVGRDRDASDHRHVAATWLI